MSAPSPYSWTDLFATKAAPKESLEFRVLNRGGTAFLILPKDRALAARALTLYAAQTDFAKGAKKALSLALRAGLPAGLNRVSLPFSAKDAFPNFLRSLVPGEAFPAFAILAGNPGGEGRRFILLLFDA